MVRILNAEWLRQSLVRQVVFALALSVVAIGLRWAVSPWLGDRHEFLPGYAAVAIATWLATWRAGLIVAAVGLAALESPLFHAPRIELLSPRLQDAASVTAFVFVAGLLVYLTHHAARRINALSDQVTRIGEADHRKSDFLALIAHELRNPLSALSVGTGLIRRGGLDERSLQGTWEMMERQTDHMKRLIGDLLDVARIEQGKVTLKRETVQVVGLIQQAVADASSYTAARRQRIVTSIQGDPGKAFADSLRIGQVLGNLLHNASKFSPEGSDIMLKVRSCGDDVLMSVQDSGIGIAASDLDTIFDSFVQLEPSSSGRPQGLGLGLALCRKLVAMHGGTVEARSHGPGHGAEFAVRLPRALAAEPVTTIADAPEQPVPSLPAAATPDEAPLRLLVVDDNGDAAESLALLLRMKGHTATTAKDGRSALSAAAQQEPDFIFLDIGLPDMTGHEVAMRLRQQVRGRQPVVVALTGWGSDDDLRRSRRNGFDGHLTKPVTMEQIDEALALVTHSARRTVDSTREAREVAA